MANESASSLDLEKYEQEIVGVHFIEDRKIPGFLTEDHSGVVAVRCEDSVDPAEGPKVTFLYPDPVNTGFIQRHADQKLPALGIHAKDIYVIISTKSGTGKAESVFSNVIEPVLKLVLEQADPGYNVVKTESHETVRKLANGTLREKAEKGVPQTIILLSGDGGVVDLINGLLSSSPPSSSYVRPTVFLFPLGTGNALFHSMYRRASAKGSEAVEKSRPDYTNALRSLLRGTPKPLPIFRATFSPSARLLSNEARDADPIPNNALYGAIVASYGLHATLVADSDTTEWRKHGDKRFGLVAKELLSPADGGPPHAYKARVVLKKQGAGNDPAVVEEPVLRDEHGYVLLAMVSNLEKTFTINPAAKPLDTQLRVVHFGAESAGEVMRIMGLAYQNGKHVEDESGAVGYEAVDGMRLEVKESGEEGTWRRVCIDGLIVRLEEGGWMDIAGVEESGLAIDIVLGE